MKNYTPIVSMLVICIICCSNMNYGASELTESEKFPHSEELPGAARKNDIKKVERLLKEGNSIDSTWRRNWTPLMEAADSGYQDLLGLLIRHRDKDGQGPEIDQRDKDGRTALIYTVFTGKTGRGNGKPGEETREFAYSLLAVGADYTIQSKDNLSFVGIIEKLSISEQEKKSMKRECKRVVQKRCDVICSEWNDIRSIVDNSLMPTDLISLFFSFLYDEKNEKLGIDKEAYLKRLARKRVHSDNQGNDSRKKRKRRSKKVRNRKRRVINFL